MANDFVAQWTGREDELAADPDARARLAAAVAAEDLRVAPSMRGRASG
ncbi:hypothetical protein BZL29_7581 [Mycobacterium kansasii]|uniref:Uncharacterized protein n=1 Tax=Mycobacterium kansasii TaxID=1768 RepID=A0A1V3WGX8_MYCKA|nr:hypothetical protein BZL29_7581 [Mycobacterium kansasii]